jgi:GT2 family glycosyltransferase
VNVGRAEKAELASVIVPCFNQIDFTMQCLAALVRFTRPPWELIVVDNGSNDGTGAYLAGVHDCAPFRVGVVSNGENLGFPAAINQGLRAARGEYLVLLNNDAVVTDGWLEQLVALAETKGTAEGEGELTTKHTESTDGEEGDGSERAVLDGREQTTKDTKHTKEKVRTRENLEIGLVGPMSNYAAPPQLVGEVGYRDLEEMQRFARRWRDERRGQWFTVNKLSGFCLLLRREVYEAVGGLDERFGLGFFDDDDLAVRAQQAGFELAVAYDLFIHHFGSRTFVGSGIDAEKLLNENSRRFAEKWGGAAGNGQRATLQPWGENSEFHAKTQRDDAKTQRNTRDSSGGDGNGPRISTGPAPGTHGQDAPVAEDDVNWLIPGSVRRVVPVRGPGDFDPYLPIAHRWVIALQARTVVELGVRLGSSTRALLAGVRETGGKVWGVDLASIHGIDDPHFHFLHADAADVAGRWDQIDLLHIDTDPHTEEQTRRWFELYAKKCRAIALHDTHHPAFGVRAAVRAFVAEGGWGVHEYWGNPSGWTVLTRPGEPSPEDGPMFSPEAEGNKEGIGAS